MSSTSDCLNNGQAAGKNWLKYGGGGHPERCGRARTASKVKLQGATPSQLCDQIWTIPRGKSISGSATEARSHCPVLTGKQRARGWHTKPQCERVCPMLSVTKSTC
eukprot:408026-Amphidinium_carterae.5